MLDIKLLLLYLLKYYEYRLVQKYQYIVIENVDENKIWCHDKCVNSFIRGIS